MIQKTTRNKVTAEISLCHLMRLANEGGWPLSQERALAFMNEDGHAFEMWKHMMHAAEDFIAHSLRRQIPGPEAQSR